MSLKKAIGRNDAFLTIKNKFYNKNIISITAIIMLILSSIGLITINSFAATPIINTTISVDKTGSEPFDNITWDGTDLTTAGRDSDEDNNVTRLQDSITYRVEVSANDSDVTNLVATVELDSKQAWIEIPTGCKLDPSEVNPVSSISSDKRTLICNTGSAIEGTTKVIFPAARAIGSSADGTEITLNDDRVGATVSAQSDLSATATDGPTETIVTANFQVDTVKELKVTQTDETTGEPLYVSPFAAGPNGENGSLLEYVIKTRYQKGSMLIDSDESTYEVDLTLIDAITDNNDNNNGAFSSNASLYNWDANNPACQLVGDHGVNATVTCNQTDDPIDYIGTAGSLDGINDRNVRIELENIDVRDPDNDAHFIELKLLMWVPKAIDIDSHQSCAFGDCVNTLLNTVLADDGAGGVGGYNPTSTEDSGGNNLLNYNGTGEPLPNEISYPLIYTPEGAYGSVISWKGVVQKVSEQSAAIGETIPFFINQLDRRNQDGAFGYACAKFDTSNYVYEGLAEPFRDDLLNGGNDNLSQNPSYSAIGATIVSAPDQGLVTFLYSTEPNVTIAEQRDDECNDDVDGDGEVNIVDENGNESNPGNPIDWYTNLDDVPGGANAVTKLRQRGEYDADFANQLEPSHNSTRVAVNHLVTILPGAGYGSNNYAPLFMSYRRFDSAGVGSQWFTDPTVSDDPNEIDFSFHQRYADRMTIVPSNHSIEKYTEPRGLKVVRGGDIVDFILEPSVLGEWPASINTAEVRDVLPSGTTYVAGSEEFSTDGGASWFNLSDYNNSSPAVTITSSDNTDLSNLVWDFGDLQSGEQLPLIKYSINVDAARTSGQFVNVSTISSDMGADQDGDGSSDDKTARYKLTILPEFGFDVLKVVAPEVYSTNEGFDFELLYKNLGGESYSAGTLIDILPFNGDSATTIGGLASTRVPATDHDGVFSFTQATYSNNEVFYVTDVDPSTLDVDPCTGSNQPVGYVPVDGDLCFDIYVDNGNQFVDGEVSGTNTANWQLCTSAASPLDVASECPVSPEVVTALKFDVSPIDVLGGESVNITLDPIGNTGGDVVYTTNDDGVQIVDFVNSPDIGNIYTNSFGGRIKEISLNVISNDVSVTPVTGTIGDYVWLDTNNDGVQDGSEAGLPDIEVSLLDGAGNPVYQDPNTGATVFDTDRAAYELVTGVSLVPYTTTTDGNGLYNFDDLGAGDYQVRLDNLPVGINQTYDLDDGYTDANGSGPTSPLITTIELTNEVDPITGNILDVNDNGDADFGLFEFADVAVENTVDKDGDGSFVEFEPLDAPGVLGNSDPTLFQYRTIVTNESNFVTATGVDIRNHIPDGVTVTGYSIDGGAAVTTGLPPTGSGGTTNFDIPVGSLAPGQSVEIIFEVELTAASASDFIAGFDNGSSQFVSEVSAMNELDVDSQPANATIPGFDPLASQDDEDDSRVTILPAIGDFVWEDLNGDGLQDAGENGIEGVTVNIYEDPNGANTLVGTITTAADGSYFFGGLTDGVEYQIEFDHSTAVGYLPSSPTQGGDTSLDSDGDQTSGRSGIITLTPGELNDTIDMGYYPLMSIGDLIFEDRDNNGTFDAAIDNGLENVRVELYVDTDGDGQYSEGTDTLVTTNGSNGGVGFAITDANGNYTFDSLEPGDYLVVLPSTNFDPSGALEGFVPSTGTNGSITGSTESAVDPDDNVDNDDNGTLVNGNYVAEAITIELGAEPTDDVDDLNFTNSTVDLGLYLPSRIGNQFWFDANGNGQLDAGENPVEGVEVALYDADSGELIGTITTGADGQFLFDNLVAGNYYIEVISLPAGYELTDLNVGADGTDSDFDPLTGRTGVIPLAYNSEIQDVFGGLIEIPVPVDTLIRTGGTMKNSILSLQVLLSLSISVLIWKYANSLLLNK